MSDDDGFGSAAGLFFALAWVAFLLAPFILLGRWIGRRYGAAMGVLSVVVVVATIWGVSLAVVTHSNNVYERNDLRAREACASIEGADDITPWSQCMAANGG